MAKSATQSPSDNAADFAFVELGATGLRQFSGYVREEWLKDLQGWRGIRMLREMRDNDPIIGAIFFAIEMLLRSVSFRVEPVGTAPGTKSPPEDIEAAAFVNDCLADLEHSWPSFMADALSMLQYGWYVAEVVYKVRRGDDPDPMFNSKFDDGMIGWRKFAPRAQETLLRWEFDLSGDATALIQLLPTGGPLLRVPLAKSIHLRTVPSKNNPEGRSILRNMYTSYYYKKRLQEIEAIGVERDLAGIPVARVPARILNKNASAEDKAQLESIKKIVVQTARNQHEGIVYPLAHDKDGHETYKLELLSTGGRRAFNTSEIIDRYDHRIAATVLADFITLGGSGQQARGSYAQSKNKTDMFAIAVVAYLDLITAEFNRKIIPDLLKLNGMKGAVRMTHGDISRRDLQELGAYILALAQAGALMPDAPLEAHLREEGGLPAADGSTSMSLNQGGSATLANADDAGATVPVNPAEGQGQGDGGGASDGTYRPTK